jgi:hypothetical protein
VQVYIQPADETQCSTWISAWNRQASCPYLITVNVISVHCNQAAKQTQHTQWLQIVGYQHIGFTTALCIMLNNHSINKSTTVRVLS